MSLFKRKRIYEVDVGEAIDAWGDTVMRVAHRCMGNVTDAEDMFQTVFMRLFKSKARIKDEEHLKAWLIRVTINCCYDELRKRRPTSVLHEASAVAEDDESRRPKSSLEKAIDSLCPPIRKTVIHLYYYEGYSTEEIAKITGEKPSTVRSHLHRARNALRISMEGAGDE
ncbi:MAG: sigma-70 family RNA polymerase sigma factor [Gordonibacter sp.]|uniref:RNA polymerase sigma factor n=1 Tax=Gordonibacter sp. TaxID=1968902 RepID=UPI002FC8C065